jgi:hypothetical protein
LNANYHNGGALNFGPDGKLYAAVGDNGTSANAQSLSTVFGKILRLNSDGTIPADNPFLAQTSGKNRAIWALGLRNPFTFAVHPFAGDLFINDVGQATWEEINDGAAGANYGWPNTEGPTTNPNYKSPRYAYTHSNGACAITGGAFYAPLTNQFPSDYLNDYFFADYCAGWIRKLDPASGNTVVTFATGISSPVDLKVAADGSLYYLARGVSAVYRIAYGSNGPTITSHPSSATVAPGQSVTFSVRASGAPPLRYQWRRNGVNISGATSQDYTIASVASSDNGARFRAILSNDFDTSGVLSNEATLTVTSNQAPTATITKPAAGMLYTGGMVINYAGTGTDPEDGTLPPSAFTWQVDFHHDAHVHPFIPATSGSASGSFTVPTVGETSANVWYRMYLTVRDSGGRTRTTQLDIFPRKVTLTLATSPSGLQLKLDGQPVATPLSFVAVVGIVRTIEAVTPQTSGTTSFAFVSWSDGGAVSHTISTPAANTTYTATYQGNPTATPSITLASVSSSPNLANVGSVSWTHAISTSNTVLIVGAVARASTDANRSVTSVTYKGIPLNRIRQVDEPVNNVYSSLWYLANAPSGSSTVRITYTGTVSEAFGAAASFTGVDQTSPILATAGYAQPSVINSSQTIASVANGWVVDIQYTGADGAVTPAAGQNARINRAVAIGRTNDHVVMTTKGPIGSGASTLMGYSYSEPSQVALSIAALRPAQSAPPPNGSITLQNVSASSNGTNIRTISWSHTVASSNAVLIVGAVSRSSTDASRPVTAVTFNGLPLTRIRQDDEPVNNVYASLWFLVNPPTGAHTLAVTYTGVVTEAFGAAASFTGVNRTSPILATAGYAQPSVINSSQTIASVANGWVVDIQYTGANGAVTAAAGQNARINQAVAIGRTNDHVVMTTKGPIGSGTSTLMGYSYSEPSQVALSITALRPGP